MGDLSEERPELAEKLSELEILRQSLEESKKKEKDVFDQLLRLNAEFQNFRKRSETRITESRRAGKEDVLGSIISLCDAMAQAEISSRNATDAETLRRGLALLKDQFDKFLTEQGLVPIKTKGEKMDPLKHEAVAVVETTDHEEGTIVDEIQRGYTLFDRVVRPSRVRVASKPKVAARTQGHQEEHHG